MSKIRNIFHNKLEKDLVSILICSRDRRRALEELVKNLLSFETEFSFEIVVTEETNHPTFIKDIIYIPHPVANRGIPFARNLCLTHARGEIIVFLDDDCIVRNDWLRKLLAPFKDKSIVGVQGGVTISEDANPIGWTETLLGFPGGGYRRVIEAKGTIQETKEISTLNCAYRRWVFEEVGGFENSLKYTGEDYILAKQACNLGRCLFIPDALVIHETRGSFSKIWHWFTRRGRAEIDVIRSKTQNDTTLWTILRGSISIKWCILIFFGTLFPRWFVPLLFIGFIAFIWTLYARCYKAWKESSAPLLSLFLLPAVKFWMDLAIDWGRIKGLFYD